MSAISSPAALPKQPQHPAIVDGDRRFTYRVVDDWANRTANALTGLGLRRGDAVAIMSRNRAEFLVTYFACARSASSACR